MRIALDARTIFRPDRRGTGKNLIDLYQHVLRLRPDWRVTAYHRAEAVVTHVFPPAVEPRCIEMRGDRLNAWERVRLPWAAWSSGADVMHAPANTCPAWMPVPTLVTIHDLIPLDMPEWYDATFVTRFEASVRRACRHAAGIICPSHYTKQRLIRDFQAAPEKITVNAWAPDSRMTALARPACQPVLDRYGVITPFVLHFGGADPRKNTRRLLEAWAMIDAAARRTWCLLIVGLDDTTRQALYAVAERLGIAGSLRLHGFADEADLPALLSAADILAYPSQSEGFGLPILDAFIAGAAVLTSNATSLPEVAGDAAVLTDPLDSCAIARGLSWLMRDARLRVELAELGRQRVQAFTWQATAQRFIAAVEQAAGVSAPVQRRAA